MTCALRFSAAGLLLAGSLSATTFVSQAGVFDVFRDYPVSGLEGVRMAPGSASPIAFIDDIASAYDAGLGGILDFSSVSYLPFGFHTSLTTGDQPFDNYFVNLGIGTISIESGPNMYSEAFGIPNVFQPNPPNPNQASFSYLFEPSNATPITGDLAVLGVTSFEYLFDPGERIVSFGLTYLSLSTFQHWQGVGSSPDNPNNIIASASFTDGTSVEWFGTSAQSNGGNDILFGVTAPEGTYLESFAIRGIGRNNRLPGAVDGIAIATVPEPSTVALLLFGGFAAFGLIRRRH